MKLNIRKIDDNRRIVCGKVTSIRPGTGDAEGRVVNVTIEGTEWDAEKGKEITSKLDIPFWNSEDPDKPQRADWINNAKMKEGSIIAVELYKGDNDKELGNRFMYSGCWNYPALEDGRNEITILMGVAANPKTGMAGENKVTRVSIPVKQRDSEDSDWYRISFWNNDDKNKLADNAEKLLVRSDGSRARIIACCGAVTENEYGKSVNGYSFELLR